jgi:hypothetical protein
LGLANGLTGRESVSEAGPSVQNRGTSGGPGGRVSCASAGQAERDSAAEGALGSGSGRRWRDGHGMGPGPDGESSRGRAGGHDRGRSRSAHWACGGGQCRNRSWPGSLGHPRGGERGLGWLARRQSCGHSGPAMPAMASRRRRGRDGSSVRVRARAGGSNRSRRSEGRKPSSLRVGWSLGVHDNKLVAEVGERRHPLGASGVSASKVTWGRVSSGPITLTGRVRRRDSKLVFQPREVWRFVVHSRSTSLTK